jgi:DNA repair protein RadC
MTTSRIVVVREDPTTSAACDSPELALGYWRGTIAAQPDHEPDKESLCVIILNARLQASCWHRVSLGSINETIAHPRDILLPVLVAGAHSFILTHNHPSGDPSPSPADRDLTRRVVEAGELLQVRCIDHVIVTDKGRHNPQLTDPYFSFQEAGLL